MKRFLAASSFRVAHANRHVSNPIRLARAHDGGRSNQLLDAAPAEEHEQSEISGMLSQEADGQHARAADAVRTEKSRVQKGPGRRHAAVAWVLLKPDTTASLEIEIAAGT